MPILTMTDVKELLNLDVNLNILSPESKKHIQRFNDTDFFDENIFYKNLVGAITCALSEEIVSYPELKQVFEVKDKLYFNQIYLNYAHNSQHLKKLVLYKNHLVHMFPNLSLIADYIYYKAKDIDELQEIVSTMQGNLQNQSNLTKNLLLLSDNNPEEHIKDENKNLEFMVNQYEKQQNTAKAELTWLIVKAFIFTPFSLIFTLPAYLKARREEPIVKIDVTRNEIDQNRKNRKKYWSEHYEIAKNRTTLNQLEPKPKKAPAHELKSTNNDSSTARSIYMDRHAYKRYTFFNKPDNTLNPAILIDSQIQSRQLMKELKSY